jgi:hypothetical protein
MGDATNGTSLSGPKVNLYLGSKFIGWGYDVNINVGMQTIPIDEFGSFWTSQQELVGGTVGVSMSRTMLKGSTASELDILPTGDTATIMSAAPISLKMIDKVTKKTVVRVEGIRLNGLTVRGGARALFTEDLNMQGCEPFFGDEA